LTNGITNLTRLEQSSLAVFVSTKILIFKKKKKKKLFGVGVVYRVDLRVGYNYK
jgi:hypothetical protein